MQEGFARLKASLRLPVIQAPMFLISGPEMVIAACQNGIIGSFPTQNVRDDETLERWFAAIDEACKDRQRCAPYAVNVIVHRSYPRMRNDLDAIMRYKPAIVITALGSPREVVDEIHGYGGLVFADVISTRFARNAIAAGVDGLILVTAGAGGHTGPLGAFAFVEELRRFWDGPLVVGGGIGHGRSIRAAEVMGADLAYLGTRFLAADEGLSSDAQKDMVVASDSGDVVLSDSFTGVKANWLRQSIIDFGLDPDNLPPGQIDFSRQAQTRWRDLWSAGQGVGSVLRREPMAAIVAQLEREYRAAG